MSRTGLRNPFPTRNRVWWFHGGDLFKSLGLEQDVIASFNRGPHTHSENTNLLVVQIWGLGKLHAIKSLKRTLIQGPVLKPHAGRHRRAVSYKGRETRNNLPLYKLRLLHVTCFSDRRHCAVWYWPANPLHLHPRMEAKHRQYTRKLNIIKKMHIKKLGWKRQQKPISSSALLLNLPRKNVKRQYEICKERHKF